MKLNLTDFKQLSCPEKEPYYELIHKNHLDEHAFISVNQINSEGIARRIDCDRCGGCVDIFPEDAVAKEVFTFAALHMMDHYKYDY